MEQQVGWNSKSGAYLDPAQWTPATVPLYGEDTTAVIADGSATLGLWAAGAGRAFAAMSPVVGWLGTALTGSDTSTNALFGLLQVTAARATGLSDVLLAAANSSGGVCGKAISPQNLAIAAVAHHGAHPAALGQPGFDQRPAEHLRDEGRRLGGAVGLHAEHGRAASARD